jgi:hypothetical protein
MCSENPTECRLSVTSLQGKSFETKILNSFLQNYSTSTKPQTRNSQKIICALSLPIYWKPPTPPPTNKIVIPKQGPSRISLLFEPENSNENPSQVLYFSRLLNLTYSHKAGKIVILSASSCTDIWNEVMNNSKNSLLTAVYTLRYSDSSETWIAVQIQTFWCIIVSGRLLCWNQQSIEQFK